MFQRIFNINSLMRVGHDVLADFGPSLSILFSAFALGAWALGLQFEFRHSANSE
jgi:hypothetical protein